MFVSGYVRPRRRLRRRDNDGTQTTSVSRPSDSDACAARSLPTPRTIRRRPFFFFFFILASARAPRRPFAHTSARTEKSRAVDRAVHFPTCSVYRAFPVRPSRARHAAGRPSGRPNVARPVSRPPDVARSFCTFRDYPRFDRFDTRTRIRIYIYIRA